MVKATLDPPFDLSIRKVWAIYLEVGAHAFGQLLDSDIGSFGLVAKFEIAQDVADGASGRMG